ncbi:tRNA (adenosine(37)-N6)-threonylcarbamoyltransferase complex ATPase subunit type 1 TsaE [Pseudovibrio sp. WM33]|uniref:tRNA (adenosine(37)-N6)-threonylcarbamoyltransferase complex ATPase subunit type 1 TsaE n=1 Tax=Pseudovibrio sp. WM33 TaxID=1735585 RepID=UPI0007AE871D|nr:tRNA (adenosine(37)-N6)-threonylcarbamoyltransferase complex ATPase subunit type 1 TsaE [Pseudovibrio sp. WM33]KZL19930.1 tRNA threonylcarbamoyladenosine biosynthesis protein TsaE [Pseudovibrio sp. WM33]
MKVLLDNQRATELFAADLAELLKEGDVLALSGDLGTGKSTLSRALLRHLAADPHLEVPSPTFTLVQTYDLPRMSVAHLDLYRIEEPEELEELGLDEYLETGGALIEWPEMGDPSYWPEALDLKLTEGTEPDTREITLTANCESWQNRLDRLAARRALLQKSDWIDAEREHVQGDASMRTYFRLHKNGETVVFMDSPPTGPEPRLPTGKTYGETVHRARDVTAFFALSNALADHGFRVPKRLAADPENGLALLEDFGDQIITENGEAVKERYELAIDDIARLHSCNWQTELQADGKPHQLKPCDFEVLITEADLYLQWYLPHASGEPATEQQGRDYVEAWRELLEPVLQSEPTLLLRDYHSPNIMWLPEASGLNKLGLIDYQDAMMGPAAYDVASLVYDARVDMPADLQEHLLQRYCGLARKHKPIFDEMAFRNAVAVLALQRNAKILGAFVRLDKQLGKPKYMEMLPRIRNYVRQCFAQLGEVKLKPMFTVILSSNETSQSDD